ncbi:MAG: ABC transporter ATP-binding protein [Candidatus Dormibacteria bacterium]
MNTSAAAVLEGRNLVKYFWLKKSWGPFARRTAIRAVDNVSLRLDAGKVTAIVGESGAGKTTVARVLAMIIKPDSGQVLLDGKPAPSGRPRSYAAKVQMVLQDPFASLNPVHRVRYQLERPLKIHHLANGNTDAAVADLLRRVALKPPESFTRKFPHELSGGQRQRVAIARALAVRPKVLIADEPVSMLDVSIRLGVLNLLADLRDKEHLAILYVTHDIASARYLADTIVVMYAGQLVEAAPSAVLTDSPAHPYAQLLLSAAPDPDRDKPPHLAGQGSPPSMQALPSGCRFHPRCPHVMDVCRRQAPPSVAVAVDHIAACWLHVDPAERGGQDNGVPAVAGASLEKEAKKR